MSEQEPQGGERYGAWFAVEITAAPVESPGESYGAYFLVDVVSVPVGEEGPTYIDSGSGTGIVSGSVVESADYGDSGSGTVALSGSAVESNVPPFVEPPVKPIVHPVAPAKKIRRKRYEDRFAADFRVIETVTERFRAGFEVTAGERFTARYGVVESGATTFSAHFNRSLHRRNADEEAVMALLMAEEDWE